MPLVKGILLFSAALFMTVILLRHWLRGSNRLSRVLAFAAGIVLTCASAAEVYYTLQAVVGSVNADLYWRYIGSTRHGDAVLWRAGITVGLVLLALLPTRRWQLILLLPGWLALLATFSYTSHAAAMGGTREFLVDWFHFIAAGTWTGVILTASLARELWLPGADGRLRHVMKVVSATGLLSVLLVAVTGTISTLFHTSDPERFIGSPYAAAWLVKIGLVAVTVAIAALNRFVFLPRIQAGGSTAGLRRNLTVEAILLLAVFAATGVLSTSELPHGPEIYGPAENLRLMFDHLFR